MLSRSQVRLVGCALAAVLATIRPVHAEEDSQPADDRLSVALVVARAVNLQAEETDRIAAQLARALEGELVAKVQSGAGVRDALGGMPEEACPGDPRCVRDIGTRLGAREVLFLDLVRISGQTQITITWADASSGRVEPRAPIRIDASADQAELFARAARALLPSATARRERPPDTEPPAEPTRPKPADDREPLTHVAPDAAGGRGHDTGAPAGPTHDEQPPVDPDRSGRRVTPGVWIAASVGAVALAGGVAFGLSAYRLDRELEEDCAPDGCPDDPRQGQRDQRILAAGILGGAAVAAGVTAVLFYAFSGGDAASPVAVTASPSSVGVTLRGTF